MLLHIKTTIIFFLLALSPIFADVSIGPKGVFAYDCQIRQGADYPGVWNGFFTGLGLSIDLQPAERIIVELLGRIVYERFTLPYDTFGSGNFFKTWHVRYGMNLKIRLTELLYGGIGTIVTYTFYSMLGSKKKYTVHTAGYYDQEVYLTALLSMKIPITEKISFTPDFIIYFNPFVKNFITIQTSLCCGFMFQLF